VAQARVRYQARPYGIGAGQIGTGTSFSSSTSILPCQCHCVGAQYSLTHLSPILYSLKAIYSVVTQYTV